MNIQDKNKVNKYLNMSMSEGEIGQPGETYFDCHWKRMCWVGRKK